MDFFVMLCAGIGYGIESIFGFAGSVVTYLLLVLKLPAKETVATIPILAMTGGLLILVSDWKAIRWKLIGKVLIVALPSMVAGILLMDWLPEQIIASAVLVVVIAYGISLVVGRNPVFPKKAQIPLYAISGCVIGATSLGVLFVPVIASELENQRSFRASLALLWFVLAVVRIPLYFATDVLTREAAISALWAVPVLILTIYIGFIIHKKIPEASYKRYVGIAILLIAVVNLVQMVFG